MAWDGEGQIVGVGDIAAQIAQVWGNIDALLDELGAARADIVKLVTYATSRDFLPAPACRAPEILRRDFYPASTFILVAGLAEPDLLVEIDVTLMLAGPAS